VWRAASIVTGRVDVGAKKRPRQGFYAAHGWRNDGQRARACGFDTAAMPDGCAHGVQATER